MIIFHTARQFLILSYRFCLSCHLLGKTIFKIILPSSDVPLCTPLCGARQSGRLSYRVLERQDNRPDCLTEFQNTPKTILSFVFLFPHFIFFQTLIHAYTYTHELCFSSFSHKLADFDWVFQVLCLTNLLVWLISPKSNETLLIFWLKPLDFRSRLLRFGA